MSLPTWKDALPAPPPGGHLMQAWMTTFDSPDSAFLVEHLLPSLLRTSHILSHKLPERTLFFGELGTALETLSGRLTVISSPPRVARENVQYPWLWRFVSHFTTGAESRAVQHAKLWAFHWRAGDEEMLELHVSSTNLTQPAFTGQVQAGWNISLPLGTRGNSASRESWGPLVPFLRALGKSAGQFASERIARLIALLGRCECPDGVTFVASIPGSASAATQLRQFTPKEIHILTPTVGDWSGQTLDDWSRDTGIAADKLRLKWIHATHPWATTNGNGWTLTESTCRTLAARDVKLHRIANESRFTAQHRDADLRWSHAKLYLLRGQRKRWLLLTSANWSVAAWGAGRIKPHNFELGVAFECGWTSLETIRDGFNPPDTAPFCVEKPVDDESASCLEWAQASWQGAQIVLSARSSSTSEPIHAVIRFADASDARISLSNGAASLPWSDAQHPPLTASFSQGTGTLMVEFLDLRPPAEFTKTPLPEVDPDQAAALRDAFLLQRYGGAAVDPEPGSHRGDVRGVGTGNAPAADYAVSTWVDARAAFDVVDQWRAALAKAGTDNSLIQHVRADGVALRELYRRLERPECQIVAEEIGWRLEMES